MQKPKIFGKYLLSVLTCAVCVIQVFSRHQAKDGTRWPQHEVMSQLNTEVDRLQQQYHVRIIGENGVAKGIIDLVNPIETW